MKLRKRRISILLPMLLLLSVFQPAVALDVDPDFEQIYESAYEYAAQQFLSVED